MFHNDITQCIIIIVVIIVLLFKLFERSRGDISMCTSMHVCIYMHLYIELTSSSIDLFLQRPQSIVTFQNLKLSSL